MTSFFLLFFILVYFNQYIFKSKIFRNGGFAGYRNQSKNTFGLQVTATGGVGAKTRMPHIDVVIKIGIPDGTPTRCVTLTATMSAARRIR
jgi:hypothetical protein